MPLIAILLLWAQAGGMTPWTALIFPAAKATIHRRDLLVSKFLHRLCGKRRANTARAVDDDRKRFVNNAVFDLRLKMAPRNMDHSLKSTLGVFVGFTHVKNEVATSDPLGSLICADLNNLRFCRTEEVSKRGHN